MRTFTHRVDDELELELVHRSHAPPVFALVEECRPYLRRWLDWVPDNKSVDDSLAWVADSLQRYSRNTICPCVIRYRGEICGTYGMYTSPRHSAGELGYWLAERFQGNGIVTRCTEAITRLAFDDFGMHRLLIRSAEENASSRAVPERLGWTYEGTWRSAVEVDGRRLDMRCYSLLVDEAEAAERATRGRFVRAVDDAITLELVHVGLAEEMFELVDRNRDHLGEWLDFVPRTTEVAHSREFARDSLQRYAAATAVRCAIRYRGELCGAVGLERINRDAASGEIGYWIGRSFQGNGIVTRAARAMTDFAFDVENLYRLEIRMQPENEPSEAVAQRLGYVHEGTARGASFLDDGHHDVHVYAMLREDW